MVLRNRCGETRTCHSDVQSYDLKAPFPDIGTIREGQKVEGPGAQIASYGHEDPGTPGLCLTTH